MAHTCGGEAARPAGCNQPCPRKAISSRLTGKQTHLRARPDTCEGPARERGERQGGKRWNYTIKRPGWCFEEEGYYLLPIGTLQTPACKASAPVKPPAKPFAQVIPSGAGPGGRNRSTGFTTKGQSSADSLLLRGSKFNLPLNLLYQNVWKDP